MSLPDTLFSQFPVPDLDDRRFDELVNELQARLARHVPEMAPLAPGDPVHALVDLFAWLTETIIYRANQIPDRQRLAFLNLLQIPLRPARPASGIVSIDATGRALPPLIATESLLKAGTTSFTTAGEVQPTPLSLRIVVKRTMDEAALAAEGITLAQLQAQYGVEPAAFRPVTLVPGHDALTTAAALDGAFHLALCLAKPAFVAQADLVRRDLAGVVLNVGVAPLTELEGLLATGLRPRKLDWELAWWPEPDTAPQDVRYLPLEVVADSSAGGRRTGVVRLRLPRDPRMLRAATALDPQFAGMGETPPEAPADLRPGQLLFWLRLSCADEPALTLGYLGINAVDVTGQGIARDIVLGAGTGRPDQSFPLAHADVDAASVAVDIEHLSQFQPWTQVAHFAGSGPDDTVFVVDAASGSVRFGDGIRGKRPPANARIRAAFYRYGGGSAGNLPADSIKELHGRSDRLALRHEWPTRGGVDGETLEQAARRIPAFLSHRDRAVTADDFAVLARDNPINPVARAEAVAGFFPGASLTAVRRNVPGVVAVFVMPPAPQMLAAAPRPNAGLLADVYDYLSARCMLGTELYVLSPQFVPVAVAVSLEVVDPATEQQVHADVERSLLRYLWALPPGGPRGAGWPRGRAVEINELRTQAGRVEGVEAVNALRLFYQDQQQNPTVWLELTGAQALPLLDYQLPELMAVAVRPGEDRPPPPRGFGPGRPPEDDAGTRAVPVPVIPDLC
ncbi:putative baseplate assembly protein [Cupriavidus consociatus]|uniref:putative baseplate assembly protein n=1 Tax=Cupriavidus consociatus TaxID=2821357 RepID=UPI001AE7FAB9|nr:MULTISPECIES: putative baseplate assembly protein [unclassified Cupriavidus]MBP0622462.1 putative baseplate assembly protein [Cupriavidus sp. LEh25]MDK2659148.1 putative baseplate assembly protein [Cupriavidus sp. LEh21]